MRETGGNMAKNRQQATIRICAALLSIALLFAAPVRADDAQRVQRLYVLNCGESETKDVSIWSPGVDVGKPREFSDSCYRAYRAYRVRPCLLPAQKARPVDKTVDSAGADDRVTIALLYTLGTTDSCTTVGIPFIEPPDT